MRSNNKPDSLVAACFGMAASLLLIASLTGCGGGAGGGGIDPNANNNPNNNDPGGINGPDIANATLSADGNTFTISSFKTGLGGFVAIDDADHDVTSANATATVDTVHANAAEGDNSVKLTVTALPTVGADPWIGLVSRTNGGLTDWSPYRYLRFTVKTGADAFGGMLAIKSGGGWTWCGGDWATIPANSSGTVTLDLAAPLSGGCTARNLADVRHHLIFTKSTGTYYIDNVRLEKDTAPVVTDTADATASADGKLFTISSFAGGLSGFKVIENVPGTSPIDPANLVNGSAAPDSVGAHATEGNHSVDLNFISNPAADHQIGLALNGNGGMADWTPFRYLRFDVTTGATAFNGAINVLSSSDYSGWCVATGSVPANSTGTLTMDMDACTGPSYSIDKTFVQRLQLWVENPTTAGHYYIDNVRLQKPDIADGATSLDGNTFTISSFKDGLSGFVAIDNADNNVTAANATATHDTTEANATEGFHSAQFVVTAMPAGAGTWLALASRSNGGLADWSPYRYLRFTVKTGAAPFGGMLVVQSGAGWNWCSGDWASIPAGSSGDVSLDLTTCTGGDMTNVGKFFLYDDGSLGTFYIDNVRLTKN